MQHQMLNRYLILCDEYDQLVTDCTKVYRAAGGRSTDQYESMTARLKTLDIELASLSSTLCNDTNPKIREQASDRRIRSIQHSVAAKK